MEVIEKWKDQIQQKLSSIKSHVENASNTSQTENEDVMEMEKRIQQVHQSKKIKENYKNIEPLESIHDTPKKAIKEENETPKEEDTVEGFKLNFGQDDVKELGELQKKEQKYKIHYETLKNDPESSPNDVAVAKNKYENAKKKRIAHEKNMDPSKKFFDSLDPPVKYDSKNPPKDILQLIYIAVLVVLNLPSVIMDYLARLLSKILQKGDSPEMADLSDYEIIRGAMVESSYLLMTFWITYIVLDYGFNSSTIRSKGPWTKFKWVPISFLKELFEILYYPTDLFIRVITKNVIPSFRYLNIIEYKSIQFVWVFCVSLFFVYNYLSKFRSSFLKCFIRPNSSGKMEMPKASSQVHLLLTFAYLSKYFGTNVTNAVLWFLFSIARLVKFICIIIFTHIMAPTAQFILSIWAFWYLLGPHFVMNGGISKISEIYDEVSGAPDKSCENSGNSIFGKMNSFFGQYMLNKIEPTSYVPFSCFTLFIWMLFFMYRLGKIELASSSAIRIWTGLVNGIGIGICALGIILTHFWKRYTKAGFGIGKSNDMQLNVPL